jgi:DNA-binding winged helix-turn-helix (wHTH) protein/tetratricopeptide (TPR) repeat protein
MEGVVRFGLFELDIQAAELRRDGTVVKLQRQPFRVLALLVRRSGEVVSRDEIRREVWGDDSAVDFDQGLGFCLSQIRAALGDSAQAPRYIQTIPRRGYRFLLPVERPKAGSARRGRRLAALVGAVVAFAIGVGVDRLLPRPASPSPPTPDRRASQQPRDPEVPQLVARGRYFWNLRTGESFHRSLSLFEEAARRDPAEAAAWSGIARAWVGLADYGHVSLDEAAGPARAAAARALALDATIAEAQAAQALVSVLFDRDWTAARRHFDEAILLDPTYAPAHQWLSHLFHAQGRPGEALVQARLAVEADPVSVAISDNLADSLLAADRPREALSQIDRTIELDPRYAPAHVNRGRALLQLGRVDEAIRAFDRAAALGAPPSLVRAYRAVAEVAGGRPAAARRLLAAPGDLVRCHYERAMILSALGDSDAALAELEASLRANEPAARWMLADETLRPLLGHPRMAELARKLGLQG